MFEMKVLGFSVPGEEIIEHSIRECHVFEI